MNPSLHTQMQIRNNAGEMNAFLTDLNDWTGKIAVKDQKLKDGEVQGQAVLGTSTAQL